jgi:hypothetical protein
MPPRARPTSPPGRSLSGRPRAGTRAPSRRPRPRIRRRAGRRAFGTAAAPSPSRSGGRRSGGTSRSSTRGAQSGRVRSGVRHVGVCRRSRGRARRPGRDARVGDRPAAGPLGGGPCPSGAVCGVSGIHWPRTLSRGTSSRANRGPRQPWSTFGASSRSSANSQAFACKWSTSRASSTSGVRHFASGSIWRASSVRARLAWISSKPTSSST